MYIKREPNNRGESPKTLFFGIMGSPFQSELSLSVLRMTEEALRQGNQVTVWTCGYATGLTQSTMERDQNIFEDSGLEESDCLSLPASSVVSAMLKKYPSTLNWYVCDYCMRERGCTHQMDGVEIKIPYTFNLYLNDADISLVLGVK